MSLKVIWCHILAILRPPGLISTPFLWLGEERDRLKASKVAEAQKAFILKLGEQ